MNALSHEQATELLHEATPYLSADQQSDLAAHLVECDQCRAYADQLKALQPRLSQALRTRHYAHAPESSETTRAILQTKRRSVMRKQGLVILGTTVVAAIALMAVFSMRIPGQSLTGAQSAMTRTPTTLPSPAPTPPLRPSPTLASAFIEFPKIDRYPAVVDWSRGNLASMPTYDPNSDKMWQMDLRSYDLSQFDLSKSLSDLLYADFDTRTTWPPADKMPAGFDWQRIMELGKNPGLGMRSLHAQGITGRGVGLAIIDQPLIVDHQEYADQIRLYEEINISPTMESQMHGSAVASIAVGKTIGVAPEADLYYIGAWTGDWGTGGPDNFTWNFQYYAQAVRRILQINQQLPENRKIRVIAIQVGWQPEQKGYAEIMAAVEEAKAAGILVVSSSLEETFSFKFHVLGRAPLADPDQFESYGPGMSWAKDFYANPKNQFSDRLLVPTDSRTTAAPNGTGEYVFYREGGWSWSIPYIAGMYTLAAQVKPSITPDEFWLLAMKTGRTIQLKHSGEIIPFGPILDPSALLENLQKK